MAEPEAGQGSDRPPGALEEAAGLLRTALAAWGVRVAEEDVHRSQAGRVVLALGGGTVVIVDRTGYRWTCGHGFLLHPLTDPDGAAVRIAAGLLTAAAIGDTINSDPAEENPAAGHPADGNPAGGDSAVGSPAEGDVLACLRRLFPRWTILRPGGGAGLCAVPACPALAPAPALAALSPAELMVGMRAVEQARRTRG